MKAVKPSKQDSAQHEGRGVVTMSFSPPIPLDRLAFRNNYTYMISVRGQRTDTDAWQPLLTKMTLMGDGPHCESGGQENVVITREQMGIDCKSEILFKSVQILMLQPSPHWLKYGLINLKAFPTAAATANNGDPSTSGEDCGNPNATASRTESSSSDLASLINVVDKMINQNNNKKSAQSGCQYDAGEVAMLTIE